MKWIKFKDSFPRQCDFPLWIYDEEFKESSLIRNDGEMRIIPRQWCIKENIYWITAKMPKKPKQDS